MTLAITGAIVCKHNKDNYDLNYFPVFLTVDTVTFTVDCAFRNPNPKTTTNTSSTARPKQPAPQTVVRDGKAKIQQFPKKKKQ